MDFLAYTPVSSLVATIVPFFIVGIAASAFIHGGFMVVEGFFIKVDDIPPGWRWMVLISPRVTPSPSTPLLPPLYLSLSLSPSFPPTLCYPPLSPSFTLP